MGFLNTIDQMVINQSALGQYGYRNRGRGLNSIEGEEKFNQKPEQTRFAEQSNDWSENIFFFDMISFEML